MEDSYSIRVLQEHLEMVTQRISRINREIADLAPWVETEQESFSVEVRMKLVRILEKREADLLASISALSTWAEIDARTPTP